MQAKPVNNSFEITIDDRMRILANFMIDKFLEHQKNYLKIISSNSKIILDGDEDYGTPAMSSR